jgi:uncharacterized protein YcbX
MTSVRGTVAELWRYPAKSMMGQPLLAAKIGDAGVIGDRGWAVRDEVRGGIRGAKKIGGLMRLAARYVEEPGGHLPPPPIEIQLPDGSVVRSDDPQIHDRLSAALDHPVTLWPLQPASDREHYRRGPPDGEDVLAEVRAMFGLEADDPLPDFSGFPAELAEYETPPGTYFDAYPLHIITTATLRSLARSTPSSRVDVRRFRPNSVVELDDTGGDPFPEQGWLGKTVRIGDVRVEVVNPCARCVMITRPFAELPEDRALLRTVVRKANQNVGVYATVTTPGVVRAGDIVTVDD